ncbi:MAG: ParE-like toxin of type bacterial toxin-antitoxin system, partial [Pseudomonadota bacterium]
LIAYTFSLENESLEVIWIDFYRIGSHENFYKELKQFLKNEGAPKRPAHLRRVK